MIVEANSGEIARAAKLLQAGSLVAFPTETVYGLGANALNESAVKKIFQLKGRPTFNPLIVHTLSLEHFADVAYVDPYFSLLTDLAPFWPGPLTVVLQKRPHVPPVVTGGQDSIALRVPAHAASLALLREAKLPIAAPSANRSAYVSPTTAEHVVEAFGDEVELVLDGGTCPVGIESTVLTLLEDTPRILRYGAVTTEQLSEALGQPVLEPSLDGIHTRVPGMLKKHYAPKTKLVLRDDFLRKPLSGKGGYIAFSPARVPSYPFAHVSVLSAQGNLVEGASKLFSALREQDKLGLDFIVADTCEEIGIGQAIMDRLRRATHGSGQSLTSA